MDKKQMAAIFAHAEKISKKQGEGAMFDLGSKKSCAGVKRWSTGLQGLDDALGGGMPKGRMVELGGPPQAGKTSLAYHLCAQHPVSLFIPAEGTFDAPRAGVFGNKPKQMLVYRDCKYAEDIMGKILEFSKLGVPLIVIDSVPGMVCKAEYDLLAKDPLKQPQYGQLSRLFGRTLKQIEDAIEISGTTVVWINQVRANMNSGPFGDPYKSPGGYMFEHAMSVKIRVMRRSWITITNYNPASSAKTARVGILSKIKVIKSKICNPYEEREFPLIFDTGYISHDDLDVHRKRLMAEGKALYKGKKVKEEDPEEDWDKEDDEGSWEDDDD